MLALIEALDFRCLKYVRQPLGPLHVLVGPNASGKTTFLDVAAFLGAVVSHGPEAALAERTRNPQDLVWRRSGERFELAVELPIPSERRQTLASPEFDTVRYELSVGIDRATGESGILAEKVLLKQPPPAPADGQRELFPIPPQPPASILTPKGARGFKTIIHKGPSGSDNFYDETGRGWDYSFSLGPRKSALANLPEDQTKFPAATWLKRLLSEGIQHLVLNSMLMRKASPPGQGRAFRPDGSNLPWVVEFLKRTSPERFRDWIAQLRAALPDLEDIRTVEREDDRHRYLVVCYCGGLEAPSWAASDGTLRLLALTLPAHLTDFRGVYLIEEPENGIHARGVEAMFQSLSSVSNAQILLATHSPVILGMANPRDVLRFAKTVEGASSIVLGVG